MKQDAEGKLYRSIPAHKVNEGVMKHLKDFDLPVWIVDRGVQYPCGQTTTTINLSKLQVLVEALCFP